MNSPKIVEQAVVDHEALTRVEQLLLRYPEVGESELTEITHFLRDGTILEIGLLSMNQDAWRKAERIRARHPKRFARSKREHRLMASTIGAILLVLALFWAIAV
jgi:hypothetical protein